VNLACIFHECQRQMSLCEWDELDDSFW